MTEIERILNQLKRAFEGEAWHGPSVLETLSGVNAEMAATRPFGSTHSIWELALHIKAWERVVTNRLRGDRAEIFKTDEDWPDEQSHDDIAWQELKASMTEAHNDLYAEIAKLNDSHLDRPILEGMSSVYVTLHGAIQHDIYHAGQIALLKRALTVETKI